ncbi:MAG: hypothetical protein H0X66_11170 [Verrucomicrobia bacterium]|nr:hypothetical protein [Verrucomicrobiota bacterium]
MSAIDTSKHLRIGVLLQVPIYQLLEDNNSLGHRNPQDGHQIPQHLSLPTVPRGALVIGGGSGEHPAIALYDPGHCVARYLEFCMRFDPSKMEDDLKRACANMQGDLQTIEYCSWGNQDHLAFRERCSGLYRPHQEELSFEGWLLMALGEFLFHVIPTYSLQIQRWHERYRAEAPCWFNAVSIPYDSYGGNGRNRLKIVDTEPCAAPNGGPAMQLGNSGVTEGPPSVS